jgi:uncharacterized SAM-binding protein YcdF (DUF218 family)
MFFFLSKTITYLIMPLSVVFICFLLFIFLRDIRWKKRFFWTGFILLLFFSNDFIANEFMHAWEIKTTPYNEMRAYAVGIVLTGATIPQLYPDDRVYFNRGADRVVHTVQLYKLGLIKKILVSGGSGRLIDIHEREANAFKEAMVLMGVPEQDIITESETRNTAESAQEVKKMLAQLNYKPQDCLLITSAFHMRRSLACYRKVGLDIDSFTTDFYAHPRNFYIDTLLLPKYEAISIWNKLVREWMGIIAYKMAGYV